MVPGFRRLWSPAGSTADHTWVLLADGTIVDATIRQYTEFADTQELGERDVPFAGEDGVAVIAAADPFAGRYQVS
jgi:hypothetical protein